MNHLSTYKAVQYKIASKPSNNTLQLIMPNYYAYYVIVILLLAFIFLLPSFYPV